MQRSSVLTACVSLPVRLHPIPRLQMQKLKHAFDVVAAMWKRSLGDMRFLYDGESAAVLLPVRCNHGLCNRVELSAQASPQLASLHKPQPTLPQLLMLCEVTTMRHSVSFFRAPRSPSVLLPGRAGSMLGGDSSPRSMGMDWHGADTVHQIDVSFPSGRLAQTA